MKFFRTMLMVLAASTGDARYVRDRSLLVALAGVAVSLALASPALAAEAGDLDPSFSGDGKLITGFGAQAEDVAIQPDGKIVAAGLHFGSQSRDFALARYNPDGTPDTGFGNDGTVTTDFAGNNDDLFAIALQPDGKIVAAGSMWTSGETADFALARYNADGSLDTGFGSGGR